VVFVATVAVEQTTFTIAEVAEETELGADTLGYHERIGLLDVGHLASDHCRFTSHDVDRVVFIGLRATAPSRSG
jgi:DNA-binding transcriptional MerR regulator